MLPALNMAPVPGEVLTAQVRIIIRSTASRAATCSACLGNPRCGSAHNAGKLLRTTLTLAEPAVRRGMVSKPARFDSLKQATMNPLHKVA